MTTKYTQRAHATLKQAPMKPASDTKSMMNPITSSGVWRKFSHVVLLLALYRAVPMIGIEASKVRRFKTPITVLLNLYMLSRRNQRLNNAFSISSFVNRFSSCNVNFISFILQSSFL